MTTARSQLTMQILKETDLDELDFRRAWLKHEFILGKNFLCECYGKVQSVTSRFRAKTQASRKGTGTYPRFQ